MTTIDYNENGLLAVGGATQDFSIAASVSPGDAAPIIALYNITRIYNYNFTWFKSYVLPSDYYLMEELIFNKQGTFLYAYVQGNNYNILYSVNTADGSLVHSYSLSGTWD